MELDCKFHIKSNVIQIRIFIYCTSEGDFEMVFSYHAKQVFVLLAALLVFGFMVSTNLSSAEDLATFTGRAVDESGKPIKGISVALMPVTFLDGRIVPLSFVQELNHPSFQQTPPNGDVKEIDDLGALQERIVVPKSKSNSEGRFKFIGIKPGMYQLATGIDEIPQNTFGDYQPDTEIQMIRVGKAIFHLQQSSYFFDNFTIGIKPGGQIENVEITVKFRMKIHGKIVFKDGTPLANERVRLKLFQCHLKGINHLTLRKTLSTDADGVFVGYIDELGIYSISAKYMGHSTGAEFFILNENRELDELVLTLNSNPLKPNQQDMVTQPPPSPFPQDALDVWVINPDNQHAYKKITCTSWEDAQTKAILEDAHLVSINSEEEQIWLEGIFGFGTCWIGLTDIAKEGEWKWDSGEPLTYINWKDDDFFTNDLDDEEKDYAVLFMPEGQWMAVGRGHPTWRTTQAAIIEKDGLQAKTPTADR